MAWIVNRCKKHDGEDVHHFVLADSEHHGQGIMVIAERKET